MLWKFNTSSNGIDKAINNWLKARPEILSLFFRVNGLPPFDEDCLETPAEVSTRFLQVLTDYLSCGHFEVFQKLVNENEKFNPRNSLDTRTIKEIYGCTANIMSLTTTKAEVKHNLGEIGEQIATLMELEDKLLNEYVAGKNKLNIKNKIQHSL